MKGLIFVALGGALGSAARYLLSGWVLHHSMSWRFPLATFTVNVIGCLIAGVLGGFVIKHGFFSADVRIFLFTGILGGFTTFSAFGLETYYLLRRGELLVAGCNIILSVVIGLIVLFLGYSAVAGGKVKTDEAFGSESIHANVQTDRPR